MAYSTISKPSLYFNTLLYTGNGSTQSITGVGFKPDWTWIKPITGTYSHNLTDIVRGVGKGIFSDLTSAEYNYGTGTNGSVRTFDSDGFSLGSATQVNPNGVNIASWNWLAGGSQGSSNTDGSTNTTYTSVNTTAGFSISQYTGTSSAATIGHGLGAVPAMIIVKNLSSGSRKWAVWHKNLSANNKYLSLSETNAEYTDSAVWNNTAPTSSVFSSAANGEVNQSGENFIAYCFAEKRGYSKFGTYTGNGHANGTFIYTGFKPAFIMVKSATSVTEWHMSDTARRPENPNNSYLSASSSAAENTSNPTDFLSNGIKIKTSNGGWNGSGNTFIYMAFAEEPLVANVGASIPATAR